MKGRKKEYREKEIQGKSLKKKESAIGMMKKIEKERKYKREWKKEKERERGIER